MAIWPAEQRSAAPAFERLYRRHVDDVYRYAAAMLPNSADAEDVVQTTFLNAFRAFEQGQRPERPQRWLIAIARNVCRQRFRQQSCRPSEVSFDDDLGASSLEEEPVSAQDIRRALSQIGFAQRTALVMRELEGRSYAEIAERLQLSHSAVETLIFRARRALREQLEGTLTCTEAGRAIPRQLDGVLARQERRALRAHLRSCSDCRSLARRMRGQRPLVKALGALPLPASLASFSAPGGGMIASVGARALLLKFAGAAAALLVATGSGYEAARTLSPPLQHTHSTPALASVVAPAVRIDRRLSIPSSQRPHVERVEHRPTPGAAAPDPLRMPVTGTPRAQAAASPTPNARADRAGSSRSRRVRNHRAAASSHGHGRPSDAPGTLKTSVATQSPPHAAGRPAAPGASSGEPQPGDLVDARISAALAAVENSVLDIATPPAPPTPVGLGSK